MSDRRRGLTLIELLVVVVILATLAVAAVAVTDQTVSQGRFDQTRSRAQQIREAILGPGGIQNGGPVVQGFVADMGRLPASIAELASPSITNVYGLQPYTNLMALTTSSGWESGTSAVVHDANNVAYLADFGAGWRGPYLSQEADPTASYGASFRDGWGNANSTSLPAASPDSLDFGWALSFPGNLLAPFTADGFLTPGNNIFSLKSYGSDNLDDSTYAPALPPSWDATDYSTTVDPDDYLVRIASGPPITITFTYPASTKVQGGTALGSSPYVYLRLYYPTTPVAVPGSTPASENVATGLTYVQTGCVQLAPSGSPTTFPTVETASGTYVSFAYPTSTGTSTPTWPTTPGTGDIRIPQGLRCLAVFLATGSPPTLTPTDTPILTLIPQPSSSATTPTYAVAQLPILISARASLSLGPFALSLDHY